MAKSGDHVIVPRHVQLRREEAAKEREVARIVSERRKKEREQREQASGQKTPSKMASRAARPAVTDTAAHAGVPVRDVTQDRATKGEVTNGDS